MVWFITVANFINVANCSTLYPQWITGKKSPWWLGLIYFTAVLKFQCLPTILLNLYLLSGILIKYFLRDDKSLFPFYKQLQWKFQFWEFFKGAVTGKKQKLAKNRCDFVKIEISVNIYFYTFFFANIKELLRKINLWQYEGILSDFIGYKLV